MVYCWVSVTIFSFDSTCIMKNYWYELWMTPPLNTLFPLCSPQTIPDFFRDFVITGICPSAFLCSDLIFRIFLICYPKTFLTETTNHNTFEQKEKYFVKRKTSLKARKSKRIDELNVRKFSIIVPCSEKKEEQCLTAEKCSPSANYQTPLKILNFRNNTAAILRLL